MLQDSSLPTFMCRYNPLVVTNSPVLPSDYTLSVSQSKLYCYAFDAKHGAPDTKHKVQVSRPEGHQRDFSDWLHPSFAKTYFP